MQEWRVSHWLWETKWTPVGANFCHSCPELNGVALRCLWLLQQEWLVGASGLCTFYVSYACGLWWRESCKSFPGSPSDPGLSIPYLFSLRHSLVFPLRFLLLSLRKLDLPEWSQWPSSWAPILSFATDCPVSHTPYPSHLHSHLMFISRTHIPQNPVYFLSAQFKYFPGSPLS